MLPGVQKAFSALFKTAADNLQFGVIKLEHAAAEDSLKKFITVFSNKSYHRKLFGKAEYALIEKRKTENRQPNALPEELHYQTLKDYIEQKIRDFAEGLTTKDFVADRKIVVAYLTLNNCRRGNECTRITLEDWQRRNEWTGPKDKMTKDDQKLLDDYSVMFIMGKGT